MGKIGFNSANENENVFRSEVLNFAKTHIPQPYEPRFGSDSSSVDYGTDNRYPEHLIEWYRKCATHATIINTKYAYIVGDGLRRKDGNPFDLKLNPEDRLPGFLQKIVLDYLIHNYFLVSVQFQKYQPNTVLAYHHKPAKGFRWNRSKTVFQYREDWSRSDNEVYDRTVRPSENTEPSTKVFFYDGYRPSLNHVYPDPDYIQCIDDIVTDLAIRRFDRNNIDTNFSARKKVRINTGANTPQKMQDEHTRNVRKFFTGVDGQSIFYEFNSPGQPDVFQITDIDSNSWVDIYKETQKSVVQNIYEGHSINSALLGKETPGSLGNTQQLQISYDMFKDNYIQQKRNELQEALSELFGFEVEFIDKPLIKPTIDGATLEKVLTKNELRQLIGYDTRPDGDVYLPQATPTGSMDNPLVTTSIQKPSVSNLSESNVNDNLRNLTPKQFQNINRIVREFSKEKITREAAVTLLKGGYGLNDDEIDSFLGKVESDDSITDEEFKLIYKQLSGEDFEKVKHLGQSKKKFKIVDEREKQKFDTESDIADYVLKNDIKGLTISELKNLIKKDLGIDLSTSDLRSTLRNLNSSGIIKISESDSTRGDTKVKVIQVNPPLKPNLPDSRQVMVMYEYVKRDEVKGNDLLPTSREFCVKLINNDRYYTRSEIQDMSKIFGYDIFKYTGGYYFNPDTNTTTPYCRHRWSQVVVSPS